MAEDPSSIHQFRAMAALEAAVADPSRLEAALDRARRRPDLAAPTAAGVEAIARGADAAPDPLQHLQDHWLSGEYFPSIAPAVIAERLADGFAAALDAARDAGRPLVPVWVRLTDDPNADDFRVDHVVTPTAVVVAVMTPRPASR